MIEKFPDKIDEVAVGCIITFKNRFFLVHRVKDNFWNSISASVREGGDPLKTIENAIRNNIGIYLKPKFFTRTHHVYNGKTIQYQMFYFHFENEPLPYLMFNSEKIKDAKFFTLEEALKLKLYEDEDYCLKLFYNHMKELYK